MTSNSSASVRDLKDKTGNIAIIEREWEGTKSIIEIQIIISLNPLNTKKFKVEKDKLIKVRNSLINLALALNKEITNTSKSQLNAIDAKSNDYQGFLYFSKDIFNLIFCSHDDKLFFKELLKNSKKSRIIVQGTKFLIPYEVINTSFHDGRSNGVLADYFYINRLFENLQKDLDVDLKDIKLAYMRDEQFKESDFKEEIEILETHQSNQRTPFQYVDYNKIEIKSNEDFLKHISGGQCNFIHWNCHLHIDEGNEENSNLYFARKGLKSDLEIPIWKLLDFTREEKWTNRILFLNSCNSGLIVEKDGTNVAEFFLKTGISFFICVSLELPNKFASEFSRKFYKNIFKNPQSSLQNMVNDINVETWRLQNNPLGFFYMTYGPNQYVL